MTTTTTDAPDILAVPRKNDRDFPLRARIWCEIAHIPDHETTPMLHGAYRVCLRCGCGRVIHD